MKEIVINHLFEKDFGVIDMHNYEHCLYVGTYDSCVGYLEEYKKKYFEQRDLLNQMLIDELRNED